MNTDFETALAELETKEAEQKQQAEFFVDYGFIKSLPEIASNVDEITAVLLERTQNDRNTVLVTPEDFDRARARCAELNKIYDRLDEERKHIKAEYMKPYNELEEKIKYALSVAKEARDNQWNQIKDAENAVKERKEAEYKAYYADKGAEAAQYRTWEQIFNKSWLNKGYTAEKVCKEIDEVICAVISDVDTIDNLNSEHAPALYEKYKSGATLKEVIAYNVALNASKIAVEQRKANTTTTASENTETATDENEGENTAVKTIDFRVHVTQPQLKALKDFLITNKIRYEKVPKE